MKSGIINFAGRYTDRLREIGLSLMPDRHPEEHGCTGKNETIYRYAAYIAEKSGCEYIIDVGCGDGKKLSALYPAYRIIGVDDATAIEACKKEYPYGSWISHDMEWHDELPIDPAILKRSVIICPGVTRSLRRSSFLLSHLKGWMDLSPACLVTSPGASSGGRRSMMKFKSSLGGAGLNVEFAGKTYGPDNVKDTGLAIIKNNGERLAIDGDAIRNFRVIAFIFVFNEEDIIHNTVMKLTGQDIGVYVLDNWSTDSTFDILKRMKGRGELIGLERFPPEGPPDYFKLKEILGRIEQLARALNADWYVINGSDEIRLSPWRGVNLKEGIFLADKLGYNCIDYTVLNFRPVDNGFTGARDLEDYFKYCEFDPGIIRHRGTWKNGAAPVSIASNAGHDISFEGRKVFPYNFILKHYPIRSQQHGERKIFQERMPRYDPSARAIGWHRHYNNFKPGCDFLSRNERLFLFDEKEFYEDYLIERLSGIGV